MVLLKTLPSISYANKTVADVRVILLITHYFPYKYSGCTKVEVYLSFYSLAFGRRLTLLHSNAYAWFPAPSQKEGAGNRA